MAVALGDLRFGSLSHELRGLLSLYQGINFAQYQSPMEVVRHINTQEKIDKKELWYVLLTTAKQMSLLRQIPHRLCGGFLQ